MKKLLLLVSILAFMQVSFAQLWKDYLPQNKGPEKEKSYTLFDYQNAFKAYCDNYKLSNTKNFKDPENKEFGIPGYSQFKRWEWYWEPRVNQKTGEFPKKSAWEVWQDYKNKKGIKSVGGTWTNRGDEILDPIDGGSMQESGTGRLNCALFDPSDNTHFWVGAAAGGLWESTDNGATWTCLTDNNPVLGVSDIAIPPDYNVTTNPKIYIASGDRDAGDDPSIGVLVTTDGGANWTQTGLDFHDKSGVRIGRIIINPNDKNIMWAATSLGVYRSADQGVNWTFVQGGNFIDMELIPGSTGSGSGTLIATTYGWSPKVYKTTDGGLTWTNTWSATSSDEFRCDVAVTPADASVVYIITADGNASSNGMPLHAIYKSTDSGSSFSQVYDGLTSNNLYGWTASNTEADGGQGWYDVAFAVSNTSANIVYVGGVNGFISTNGATSFSICNAWDSGYGADVIHADHHNAYFVQIGASDRLFDVNDGGFYYSDNFTSGGSSTWTAITDGLVTGQLYDIGIAQTVNNEIISGFQDNGTKLVTSTSTDFDQVIGGDGMCCAINPTNNSIQYGTYAQMRVYKSTNNGGSFSVIRNSGSADWAGPVEADPQGGEVYIGDAYVKQYSGHGTTWTSLSQSLDATDYLKALDVFDDGTNTVIWAASPAGCWKSPTSGSGTYTAISGLPADQVTDIAIDEDDYNHVYVCFGGFDNYNVYETTNGGTSWTDISEGLPAVPCGAIVINEQNTTKNEVYLGTDAGIYVRLGNAPWQLFTTGMPYVSITDLEIYYGATPVIYASTYGRGVWSSDCYDPPTLDASISYVSIPATEYCSLGNIVPTVKLGNIGTTTLTSATISYTIDGGAPVTQNWTGSLAQGATTNIVFPSIALTYGTHDFTATVSNPNGGTDSNADNDTKEKTFSVWNNDVPYTQAFDNFTPAIGYNGDAVVLEECWTNDTGESSLDWSVTQGETPSGSTGPAGDHTGSGKYLYTEVSGISSATSVRLLSPTFDLTNYTNNQISFWYNMNGANCGSLQIDLFYSGSWHNGISASWNGTTATSVSGNKGQTWFQVTADISAADGDANTQIRISSTSGTAYDGDIAIDDFNITGTVSCTQPTTQAGNFSATPTNNTIALTWTRGDGDNILVVARKGNAVNTDPTYGINYTANATYGSGQQIGTGNYAVYNGTGGNVTITGLTSGTTYYFALYEFNNTGVCYLMPALTGNTTTDGSPFITTDATSAITTSTAISGGNVTADNGSAVTVRGVCWNTSGTPTTADNTTSDGSGTGTFTSSITGLSANTTYYVRAYATNTYGTSYGNEEIFTTLKNAPTVQALNITFPTINSNDITASWTNGNGDRRIVKVNTINSFSDPVDGTDPAANTVYGGGEQVVYNGTGNSVTVTGLTTATQYWFRVYEYNNTGTDTKYYTVTATNNPNSATTLSCTHCYSWGNTTYATSTTGVIFNTINNTSAKPTDGNGNAYSDYTAQSTDITIGNSYNLTVNVNTDGNYTVTTTVWIDWNQNCDFTDAGEKYVLGTANNTADGPTTNSPLNITVPAGALTGNTIMRVSSIYNTTESTSCQTDFDGEVEDYTVNVLGLCTYPSTQASAFTTTPSTTSINVGWTRGNGDAVIVVARDGGAVNADPTDGVSYTANATFGSGTQIGTGNYVVYDGTGTSVNVTGLTSGNTYYFAIYEYSSTGNCYLTSALTGNSTTTVTPPSISTVSPNSFFADKGATLTITGSDLGDLTTSVTLGGITGNVTSNNGSTLVVDFPAGHYTNSTLTVSTGVNPDATSTVTVNTRNVIPVGGGTDYHATIQDALDGLFDWFGTNVFSTNTTGYLAGTKTIEVYSGTYTDIVTPNVNLGTSTSESLIIQNASGQQPVINASGNANAFYIGALDYVTISGFTAYSSTDALIYTEGDSNTISMNKLYGSTAGAGIILNNAASTTVQNNLIYNNNTFGIRLISSNNAVVKNNTVANNGHEAKAPPLPGVYTPAQLYVESGTGVSAENNIFYAKSGSNVFTLVTESGITVSSDYNTYYKNGNTSLVFYNGTTYADLAAWSGNGAGANDLEGDPLFVNAGTDFHIQSTNGSYPYPAEWPPEASASAWNNDASTSPALDTGNPSDSYSNETVSGGRINQGAYGNTAQASKSAGIVWDGSENIDWQTLNNWTPNTALPTATDDIIIPDGCPNYPVIDDGTTTAVCNNLTIAANASVTIAANGQMTVSGSITNNRGAAGLIIKSDASGDGSLIVNNTPEATVERFVSGNQWHMMFPTLSSVPTSTFTTEGSDVNYNFYSYNEPNEDYWTSTTVYGTSGWTSEVGATNIRTDKGYLFNRYNMGDKTFVQTGGNLSAAAKTFNVSYNISTITIENGANSDRTYYDGWNLAGNPYTSAVDWDQITLNGIESGVYYFDGTNYKYFMQAGDGTQNPPYDVGISLNGGSQFIPSGQGFMVKVSGAGTTTFTIPISAKAHNDQTYWKSNTNQIPNFIKLNIEKDGYTDETLIRTLPVDVTENHDAKYDAYKMFAWDNSKPQIYSFNNYQSAVYAINSLPEITENKVIPLGIYIGTAGEYSINNLENNFEGFDIYLHDILQDKYTLLTDNSLYTFDSEIGTILSRFELVFEKSISNINDLKNNVLLYPNPNKGSFYLSINNAVNNFRVEITNVTGQLIYQNKFYGNTTKEIKLDHVSDGIYFVKVIFDNNKTVNKKIVLE